MREDVFALRQCEKINFVFLGYAGLEIMLSGVKPFLQNIFSSGFSFIRLIFSP